MPDINVVRLLEKNKQLREALWPFTTFNSSEEYIDIRVKTEWVTRARRALSEEKDTDVLTEQQAKDIRDFLGKLRDALW